MARPTAEQIKEARDKVRMFLAGLRHDPNAVPFDDEHQAIRTLLAATDPPTDEEIRAIAYPKSESDELHEALDGLDRCSFYACGFEDGTRHFLGAPEGK